jgi:hypothetical protein
MAHCYLHLHSTGQSHVAVPNTLHQLSGEVNYSEKDGKGEGGREDSELIIQSATIASSSRALPLFSHLFL